jgi:integrase
MKPTIPKLNTANPKKWFIYFNVDVPTSLLDKYKTKRVRVKKYDDINRFEGEEKVQYAKERLLIWQLAIKKNIYNHFEKELRELSRLASEIKEVKQDIADQIEINNSSIVHVSEALDLFIASREARTDNKKSISMWKATTIWFKEYLKSINALDIPIADVTRKHIADALSTYKVIRSWSNTTYNNQCTFLMTIFNWLAVEEYIIKNPAKGRIERMKRKTSSNRWYDRETARKVKSALYKNCRPVYYAAAFTYSIAVRSQQELIKLKVGDIDLELSRLRFRKEVSKNGKEAFREWPVEFDRILNEMELSKYPDHFYIFGKNGVPGPQPIGINWLSYKYRMIRKSLKLDPEYTLYSFKHTRVVHEMMKGTDPYEIQHLCRHSSLDETQHYMRGFDLSLKKVYEPKDLTF